MTTSEEFPFPFPPYIIQKDFMMNLYTCLENGNLGIFESPTGTGKSLSIICGALKWLVDNEKNIKDALTTELDELNVKLKEISDKSGGDWFAEQTEQMQVNAVKRTTQDKLDALDRLEERRNKFREKIQAENLLKRKQRWKSNVSKSNNKEIEVKLSEDSETKDQSDIDLLLDDMNLDGDSDEEEDTVESMKHVQFFFCSRTHSQLTQFIGEVKRSPYADKVSLVPLASRQSYCINKSVKKLGHVNLINDRCLQLQKKTTTLKKEKDLKRSKTATSCPFNPGNQDLLIADIVTNIQDVEEIAESAKQMDTCAYYASRRSLPDCQVILVPYNNILHKNTRISSGINLKNSILIIDEAHNLLEAIERMYSVNITGRNIIHCLNQLSQYQKRFASLFSAKSVLYLNQLSFCLKRFTNILGGTAKSQVTDKVNANLQSKVYTIEKFETEAEIDMINVFELLKFINKSKLVHKLRGYIEKYNGDLVVRPVTSIKSGLSTFLNTLQNKNDETQIPTCEGKENIQEEPTAANPLIFIISFLESLQSHSADGRIFVIPGSTMGQGTIKFLLMNPAAHFHDIVKEAKSVILAGGTMEPISQFRDQLFLGAGAEPERIVTFSCDHVIPKENILTRIVTQGPTNVPLEFTYQNRQKNELMNEVGRTLKNLCNIIPGGMVVFLPSYSYEDSLYKFLEASGTITKIQEKKKIFREPKNAAQVNSILENYSQSVYHPKSPQNGALLFSVVGGKLSEGLNFSDDLGRCVVVIGMPYPNIKSAELQEKMKYLDENVKPGAGHEYYENACMKAVNQCIGRAIRHINDYSTVILLDKRYANKTKSLPGWIQRTLTINNVFSGVIGDVAKFFALKKRAGNCDKKI